MSYEKLQAQSPFLTHLKNYPLEVKLEKFLLSFSIVVSIVEFVSSYVLKFKALLKEYLPTVSEYGYKFEKLLVDDLLIKYVDVYLYFIKEDFHLSDLTENKYVNSVKNLPGVQASDKLLTDTVSLINVKLIITLGKLIKSDVGKDYKPSTSISKELYSSTLLLDSIASATKDIVLGYVSTTSIPKINGSVSASGPKVSASSAPAIPVSSDVIADTPIIAQPGEELK